LSKTFTFIQQRGGVPLESDDPYQEKQTTCTSEPNKVQIAGWGATKAYSASSIMAAVAKQPVAFIFDVAEDFELYKSGIYSSDKCLRTGVGPSSAHAMVIVGFNTASDPPYWIVRNSWGAGDSWGMDGYGYIKMDPDNTPGQCSMYLYATYYPTSAQVVGDSTNQVQLSEQEPIPEPSPSPVPTPPVPTPNDPTCVAQTYNNQYISRGNVLKTLVVKDLTSCASAAVANNGGSFNFAKKTKKCTIMQDAWSDVSQYLLPNKSMVAGYPNCTSSTKKSTKKSTPK
jgi:hypothetical protein